MLSEYSMPVGSGAPLPTGEVHIATLTSVGMDATVPTLCRPSAT